MIHFLYMKEKKCTQRARPRSPVSTADLGVLSSFAALSHTFVEIDCVIISTAVPSLQLIHEGLLTVINESMCTKICLAKLA